MGCLASAASAQVCQHTPGSHSHDTRSEPEKLSAASGPTFWKPKRRGLSSVLDAASTALGSRGMVQSASRSLSRTYSLVRLGYITAFPAVSDFADTNATGR